MKSTVKNLTMCALLSASVAHMPAQAAVIDQVKNKVDAIKNDTASIKNKTSNLQVELREVASTANAQMAESIDIREVIEPLTLLQDIKVRFANGGFDPAELMEVIDIEELQSKVEEMKAEKQAIEDAMYSNDLEQVRSDLLSIFNNLSALATPPGEIPLPSPMASLIERAPAKLLGGMALAMGNGSIQAFKDDINEFASQQAEDVNYFLLAKKAVKASAGAAKGGKMIFDVVKTHYCQKSKAAQEEVVGQKIYLEWLTNKIIIRMELLKLKFGDKLDKDHQVAIHGYVGVQMNIGKRVDRSLEHYLRQYKDKALRLKAEKELLMFKTLNKECI